MWWIFVIRFASSCADNTLISHTYLIALKLFMCFFGVYGLCNVPYLFLLAHDLIINGS